MSVDTVVFVGRSRLKRYHLAVDCGHLRGHAPLGVLLHGPYGAIEQGYRPCRVCSWVVLGKRVPRCRAPHETGRVCQLTINHKSEHYAVTGWHDPQRHLRWGAAPTQEARR